jgi:hypothetical protein
VPLRGPGFSENLQSEKGVFFGAKTNRFKSWRCASFKRELRDIAPH